MKENKEFFRKRKTKSFWLQHMSSTWNVQRRSSGKRNMLPGSNLDLHKEMKIPGNVENEDEYKRHIFCLILIHSKDK